MKHGNWMAVKADDLSVIESGWYQNNQRISDMKDHDIYKNFKVIDIFYDINELIQNIEIFKQIISDPFPKTIKINRKIIRFANLEMFAHYTKSRKIY